MLGWCLRNREFTDIPSTCIPTGVDLDAAAIKVAEERRTAQGVTNVEF